jgi:steroid delta-isomerase-like uncharacterized protein
MGSIPDDRRLARMATVEQHVRFENAHDLNGVLGTFGDTAHYDDEAWGEHYNGRDGVRTFYVQLMSALPDLNIEILRRHTSDEVIVLEVMIRGTHLGPWRGLPATGERVEIPLCGVYTFDEKDRLAGERDLLRSRDCAPTTRRLSRAKWHSRADRYFTHPSHHCGQGARAGIGSEIIAHRFVPLGLSPFSTAGESCQFARVS